MGDLEREDNAKVAKSDTIYVAGHGGLVGSAIARRLKSLGYLNIVGWRSSEFDLTRQDVVEELIDRTRPKVIFLVAARVGGIGANATLPAEFVYQNMMIETNIIHAASCCGVERLIFTGSSCIYPVGASQPISESALLTGDLDKTIRPYGLAKSYGIELCKYYNHQYGTHYLSVMPTNLYGPNDTYHSELSHVM